MQLTGCIIDVESVKILIINAKIRTLTREKISEITTLFKAFLKKSKLNNTIKRPPLYNYAKVFLKMIILSLNYSAFSSFAFLFSGKVI